MSAVTPLEAATLPIGFLDTVGASSTRLAAVETYRTLLTAANERMNLVGASTLPDFWLRHFVDSAQLLWFSPGTRVWADLGAGAGLPGLILAILLKDVPGAQVHLVESMAKCCDFLREVIGSLGLPATVHNARAETLDIAVEVVTARACAPLDRLLGYAERFFSRGARGLFLKGSEVEAEIVAARKRWRFTVQTRASLSDPRGRVLSIEEVARVGRR